VELGETLDVRLAGGRKIAGYGLAFARPCVQSGQQPKEEEIFFLLSKSLQSYLNASFLL